jgi:cysteine/O-acetylserine efflux protein
MTSFYPFLIYVLVTTFTPGPNNILAMSNAMRQGYQRTIGFLAGIFTGFFVVMALSGLLNVALAALLPSLKVGLNLLGAMYMLYLAYHILRSKPVEDEPEKNELNSFKAGFTLQFLNIKVILYGITVFSLFIIADYQDPWSICLFSVLLAGVGFVATSCWALGGNLFRKTLRKNTQIFNVAMAALLIYTAVASLLPGK